MQKSKVRSEQFKAHRRQLLRMGAAGLPMVLTLRASASEALISQLRCTFTIPSKTKILVDDTGQAWVGKSRLRIRDNKPKNDHISNFQNNADYVFPEGTVPSSYRADACPPDPCDGYAQNLKDANVDSMFAHLTDSEGDYQATEGFSGGGGGSGGHSNHIHCDSHGHQVDGHHHSVETSTTRYAECGYKAYKVSNNQISPGDYINNGSWNLPGDEDGLYLSLSLNYADSYGNTGGWPGISCIVSILNYLNL
ncbi:MAG: hypothetical protein KUG56_06215 [Kordiimonadaceae bacterium]|nr:hypothetical protein [Kordiimonadaceae bacterium]